MNIDEVIGVFECKKCGYRTNLTIDFKGCPICKLRKKKKNE